MAKVVIKNGIVLFKRIGFSLTTSPNLNPLAAFLNSRPTPSFLLLKVLFLHIIDVQNPANPLGMPTLPLGVQETHLLADPTMPNPFDVFVAMFAFNTLTTGAVSATAFAAVPAPALALPTFNTISLCVACTMGFSAFTGYCGGLLNCIIVAVDVAFVEELGDKVNGEGGLK